MADTLRKTILEQFYKTISDANYFSYVKDSRLLPQNFGLAHLPACFVYVENENKILGGNEAVIGKETWELNIVTEMFARESDIDTTINTTHKAIMSDNTLQTMIGLLDAISIEYYAFVAERDIIGVAITWRMLYRHKYGDMTSD